MSDSLAAPADIWPIPKRIVVKTGLAVNRVHHGPPNNRQARIDHGNFAVAHSVGLGDAWDQWWRDLLGASACVLAG